MTYDKNNIFAKIIRGDVPSEKLYEDEHVIAIADIEPAAPSHVLVMPKAEYTSFDDFALHASPEETAGFWKAVAYVAHKQGLKESGYRIITNHGKHASQTVPHFHVHVLGGKAMGRLLPGDGLL